MISPFAVWSPGSVVSSLLGGFLLGYLLVARFENPRFTPAESVGVILILGIFAGVVFFAPNVVDTLTTDGPGLAWRVVSRFLLFVLFVVAMAAGTGIGVGRNRR